MPRSAQAVMIPVIAWVKYSAKKQTPCGSISRSPSKFKICRLRNWYLVTKDEIKTPEDMSGKQIRVVDDLSWDLVESFGGIPLKMPLSEVYDSLSKGIIDGVIFSISNVESNAYDEITSYVVSLGIQAPVNLQQFMREDAYLSMSEEQRAAFDACVEDYQQAIIEDRDRCEQSALEYCEEKGVTINHFSEEDLQRIKDVANELGQAAAAELDAMGYDGTGIYKTARELVAEYELN